MKKHLSTIILVLVLVLGLGIMLYPTVSDWWNSFHQTRAIASYSDTVATMDNEIYDQLWQEAEAYNAALAQKANPYFFTEEDQALYDSTLNVSGTGIMGYIDIPEIKCTLPIYHGTSEAVLQVGVGHIEGSSLPVGGEGTHCVLSGHSGLPSAVLFTHLEDLDIGDLFTLQIMDETLTYEVDRFNRVLPHEMDLLTIEEGKDSCTLVTCTPYGINTHRLLVHAHRVANEAATAHIRVTADAVRIDPILVSPAAAVPMLLLLFLWLMFGGSKTPKKPKKAK
jgi:sortase A